MSSVSNNSLPSRPPIPSSRPPPIPQSPTQANESQIYNVSYLALEALSKQYLNNIQQNSIKSGKNKEFYPQFVTNSSGKILALGTTLKKEERADIKKVESYITDLLKNDRSIDENKKNTILEQLKICKFQEEKEQINKQKDNDVISNKIEKLNIKVKEKSKIKTRDGCSYSRTTFITNKNKARLVKLYEDSEGPIALVYPSSKGTRRINNNLQVNQDLLGEILACRHMAMYQLRHRDENWQKVLGDKEEMSKAPDLDGFGIDVEDFLQGSERVYMCPVFNIGEALYKLTIDSKNSRPGALFITSDHVMSISIEKRKKGGIVLKFYDPNISDNVTRVILPSIDHLKKLKVDFLLNDQAFNLYFPADKIDNTPAITNKYENLTQKFFNQPTHEIWACFKSYDDPMDPTGNWQDTKTEIFTPKAISKSSKLNRRWLMENLRGSMKINQNNVGDIINTILNSKLTKEEKFLCMKAGSVGKNIVYPVITNALLHGSPEALKVYIQAVLTSDFSDEEKYELLGGLKNGNSFLYAGFNGEGKYCEQTVMAYVKTIIEASNSHLPLNYKVKLLRAEMEGLFGLVACKKDELKVNFINFIKESNLEEREKNEILGDSQ